MEGIEILAAKPIASRRERPVRRRGAAAGQPPAAGPLLAALAHELNNPITILTSLATLLEQDARDTEFSARAGKIRTAAERCGRILQSFVAMARQRPPVRRAIDLNRIVRGVADLLGPALDASGTRVVLNLTRGLPRLRADPDQLHQVLVNLLINADQAMAGQRGTRTVSISTRATATGGAAVDVSDTGPGVSEHIVGRLFEPFVTTKATGSGLGLSLSRAIAQAHGGSLDYTGSPEGGARFTLVLPPRDLE